MTDAYADSPRLTAEQSAVVDLPPYAKALVTAGAGSGKTHTLVRRLDALIADHGLAAGEILVLTFSRAAVRDLSARLIRTGQAARFVRAQTFDSWALFLLTSLDATVDWNTRPFDERIRAAEDLIGKGAADPLFEDGLLHLVIDEAQDLVGARRDLVESLLTRYDCGFTIVGDLAQAIYGFQVADPNERAGEAGRFVQWLRRSFDGEMLELELTRNFRARTVEARVGLRFSVGLQDATALGSSSREFSRQRRMLRNALRDLASLGDPTTGIVRDALRDFDGTAAVLCRTNGEALLISESLREGAIPHRLQASSRDRVTPGWLADLFPVGAGALLTRDEFERLSAASEMVDHGFDRATAWSLLHAAAREGRSPTVSRSRLAELIAAGWLPDELVAPGPTRLLVSSIHRAKGLEFDRVIIAEPTYESSGPDEDVAEEVRLLYVALTRARDDLLRMTAPDVRLVRRIKSADRRWARYGWKAWMRRGLELRGGDVSTEVPAGVGLPGADPGAVQLYLRSAVTSGDGVVLELDEPDDVLPDAASTYRILHRDRLIGSTSAQFSKVFSAFLGGGRRPPRRINGGYVESVEAVRGGRAAGAVIGAEDYGVWLAPRLGGLTRFEYDGKEASSGDE